MFRPADVTAGQHWVTIPLAERTACCQRASLRTNCQSQAVIARAPSWSSRISGRHGQRSLPRQKAAATFTAGLASLAAASSSARRASVARASAEADWREFRARLVEREQASAAAAPAAAAGREEDAAGWAHATPLIEQGSVLLSVPGDQFALDQQYFHKAVILILRHNESGDVGVILNRPSAFSTEDLGIVDTDLLKAAENQIRGFLGLGNEDRTWNVWFGGDCFGPTMSDGQVDVSCLYISDRPGEGEEIIRGLCLVSLQRARELVATGEADQGDFLILAGYCGWGPGQLQAELDRGESWMPAAVDRKALLGDLRIAQAQLSAARARETPTQLRYTDLGDGLEEWRRLYRSLGQDAAASEADGEERADAMLRHWIEEYLIKLELPDESSQPAVASSQVKPRMLLRAGTVLRGSASEWLLGGPRGWQRCTLRPSTTTKESFRPAQYFHKAVLLCLKDVKQDRPAVLVLLNGPRIGVLRGGQGEVFFGGMASPETGQMLEIPNGGIWGQVILPAGELEDLLQASAFEVADDVQLRQVFDAPPNLRWAAAGGRLKSLRAAAKAALGDARRKQWYQRYLGIILDEE